jgi:hypothetical protein
MYSNRLWSADIKYPWLYVCITMHCCYLAGLNLFTYTQKKKRCYRRLEEVSWTDYVKRLVLRRVKDEMCILHTMKRRKANWIGHVLRRKYLVRRSNEVKIEGTR